jgi:hypothetical protein
MSDHNAELSDFMKKIYAEREAHQREQASVFSGHIKALLASGVTTVLCEYNGYGDSGGVENVIYLDENNKPIPRNCKFLTDVIDGDIRNYAESLLPDGFENNEGGQGTVTLDLKGRTYSVDHGQNVTEVQSESWGGAF